MDRGEQSRRQWKPVPHRDGSVGPTATRKYGQGGQGWIWIYWQRKTQRPPRVGERGEGCPRSAVLLCMVVQSGSGKSCQQGGCDNHVCIGGRPVTPCSDCQQFRLSVGRLPASFATSAATSVTKLWCVEWCFFSLSGLLPFLSPLSPLNFWKSNLSLPWTLDNPFDSSQRLWISRCPGGVGFWVAL